MADVFPECRLVSSRRVQMGRFLGVLGTAALVFILSDVWVRYNCSNMQGCQGLPGIASKAVKRHLHRRDLAAEALAAAADTASDKDILVLTAPKVGFASRACFAWQC